MNMKIIEHLMKAGLVAGMTILTSTVHADDSPIPGATTLILKRQITTGIMRQPCRWTRIRREPVTTESSTWPATSSSGSPIGMIHSITAGCRLW